MRARWMPLRRCGGPALAQSAFGPDVCLRVRGLSAHLLSDVSTTEAKVAHQPLSKQLANRVSVSSYNVEKG